MEEDHFQQTSGHQRASQSAARNTSSSCATRPPVEVIIIPNNSSISNATGESGSSGTQIFEDFYQGQIFRRRSLVQALKLQRAHRTSSYVTTSTAASTSSISPLPILATGQDETKSVGSGCWRNRIISRYTSSMLELSTTARNRNVEQNMKNATWGENNNEDAKHSSSLFSTKQTIHQNRERLLIELLRPSTSCGKLSSPNMEPLSIKIQDTNDNFNPSLLDTSTTDSALSLSEIILARRDLRRKSMASLRELRQRSESIPVMINHRHQQQQQQKTQVMNSSVSHNSLCSEHT